MLEDYKGSAAILNSTMSMLELSILQHGNKWKCWETSAKRTNRMDEIDFVKKKAAIEEIFIYLITDNNRRPW